MEKPFRYNLKVAMSHVVHEIDICEITQKTENRSCSSED
jgi:hypothetical protein